ncbi:MAG TPA: hypothetical protein VHW65_10860 [Gemmatimonadales bacterium]|jgi:hypothetical protein|nr:hypothetical protein [Gemmatimonadales bacterium]
MMKRSTVLLLSAALVAGCSSDTVTIGPAASLTYISGSGQLVPAGVHSTGTLVVRVADAAGNGVEGDTVYFTSKLGATLGTPMAIANAAGLTSTTYVGGSSLTTDTVTATVTGIDGSVTFSLTVVAGPPSVLNIVSGNNQSVAVGTASAPLVVSTTDAFGHGTTGATVTWTAFGGTMSVPSSVIDSTSGMASAAFTPGSTAGLDSVEASVTNTGTNPATIVIATFMITAH